MKMTFGTLKSNKIIFFALSLIIFVLLNSVGNTEARPTDASQSHAPKDNHTVELLEKREDPSPVGDQESGIQVVEPRFAIQLDTSEVEDAIEWLEQLENPQPGNQDDGIQKETSGLGEVDLTDAESSQNPRSARIGRSSSCVQRYEHRIYYNRVFKIAICKSGCKKKVKFYQFSNGRTLAYVYDCY